MRPYECPWRFQLKFPVKLTIPYGCIDRFVIKLHSDHPQRSSVIRNLDIWLYSRWEGSHPPIVSWPTPELNLFFHLLHVQTKEKNSFLKVKDQESGNLSLTYCGDREDQEIERPTFSVLKSRKHYSMNVFIRETSPFLVLLKCRNDLYKRYHFTCVFLCSCIEIQTK